MMGAFGHGRDAEGAGTTYSQAVAGRDAENATLRALVRRMWPVFVGLRRCSFSDVLRVRAEIDALGIEVDGMGGSDLQSGDELAGALREVAKRYTPHSIVYGYLLDAADAIERLQFDLVIKRADDAIETFRWQTLCRDMMRVVETMRNHGKDYEWKVLCDRYGELIRAEAGK